jgi:hypothetical protein
LIIDCLSVYGVDPVLRQDFRKLLRIPTKSPGYNGIMPPGIPE